MSEGVRTLFLRDGEGHSVYTGEFDVRGDVMTIDGLTDAAGNAALGETSLVRLAEGQAGQGPRAISRAREGKGTWVRIRSA